jgi:hypothetical protein
MIRSMIEAAEWVALGVVALGVFVGTFSLALSIHAAISSQPTCRRKFPPFH